MRILITNDDGIDSPGLAILKNIAEEVAGSDGTVWCVAPATEQSGTAHGVSFVKPFAISETGKDTFAVEGTPADCVLAGIYHVMPKAKPDLVLSGINRGNNSGENTLYSGTVGAAIEASLHGITGIALSQYLGKKNRGLDNPFECAEFHSKRVIDAILRSLYDNNGHYPLFYNVNFPPCSASEVVGIRSAVQGLRGYNQFTVKPVDSIATGEVLWIRNGNQDIATRPETDVSINLDGFISITPMRADLTAFDAMARLDDQLQGSI